MPSEHLQTMIDLAYGYDINRFFRIKVENGETILEGADGADYPFLRWRGDLRLPLVKSIGIEFNGIWEYDTVYRRYNFMGDKKPFIFWVEMDGNLYVRLWDEEDTTFLLATNVEKCATVRGWKNINFWNHDHGVVIAYVKTDGCAYYRTYARQPPDFPEVWESERLIPVAIGEVQDINVFRTNDYRTGILLESNGKIYWTVTDRNWAGMAVPAEYISVAPSVELEFTEILYPEGFITENISVEPKIELAYLFASTENEIKEVINAPDLDDDWGWIINIKVQNPIPVLTLYNITVLDLDKNTLIAMTSVEKIDDFNFKLHVSDIVESGINNITGDIKISITNVKNEAEKVYENMVESFTPINLVPTHIPLPEVDEIWNE